MSNFRNKKPADIVAILEAGKQTDFWQIIRDALQQSIDHLTDQQDSEEFKDLPADRYKLENELMKSKKIFLKTLMETPDNIASWLVVPDNKIENFDPYAKDTSTGG